VLQLVTFACKKDVPEHSLEGDQINVIMKHNEELERSISVAVGYYGPRQAESAIRKSRDTLVSDLHRIACLLYVNRAVHRVSDTDFRHKRLANEGILLLEEMKTCQHAWPLFIIACEASSDWQRLKVLEVLERSRHDERRRANHIHLTQQLVETVWKQQDLSDETPIDHLTILDAVIGAVPFIPPFA
jgi:hypothetical protein